jgi:hypothetical protein
MSSRLPPNELDDESEKQRPVGGGWRVARLFLPHVPSSDAIRLTVRKPRHTAARRRLGRLIDSRRVVS